MRGAKLSLFIKNYWMLIKSYGLQRYGFFFNFSQLLFTGFKVLGLQGVLFSVSCGRMSGVSRLSGRLGGLCFFWLRTVVLGAEETVGRLAACFCFLLWRVLFLLCSVDGVKAVQG